MRNIILCLCLFLALFNTDIAEAQSLPVGTPVLEDASVSLKVVNSFRGEKITVFKMKSKKRYSRTRGFRPELTALTVTAIA